MLEKFGEVVGSLLEDGDGAGEPAPTFIDEVSVLQA
jgi:hypothetical protein